MQGPSYLALQQGGQGGALKYKVGVQVLVQIASGGPPPPAWKKKTTLQGVFGEFGQVLEIHTQDDGTAIVEFEDRRDAIDAAESMDGKKICGVAVRVQIRQDARSTIGVSRGGADDRVTELAIKYCLDATSTARLVGAFRDRSRRGCNLDLDIKQLSDHLAASNKPSALVCMKLADLRDGKPIGPCRYNREREERERRDRERDPREREPRERETRGSQPLEPPRGGEGREPRSESATAAAPTSREGGEPMSGDAAAAGSSRREHHEHREPRDRERRHRSRRRSRSRRRRGEGETRDRSRERTRR